MQRNNRSVSLTSLLRTRPNAVAGIRGSEKYPSIYGTVRFYETGIGVIVIAELNGLPNPVGQCTSPIFGFHIHGGNACRGNADDPFADAGSHYNPHDCPHPYHAGDLPPLFGANGHALSVFLTDRFTVKEILGKTVIVHSRPDDFTTQPSGNSGEKMACGVIRG